jgi:hypothetical protein
MPDWKRSLLLDKVRSFAIFVVMGVFHVVPCMSDFVGAQACRGRGADSRSAAAGGRAAGALQRLAGVEAEAADCEASSFMTGPVGRHPCPAYVSVVKLCCVIHPALDCPSRILNQGLR